MLLEVCDILNPDGRSMQIGIVEVFNPCMRKLILKFFGVLGANVLLESNNLESLDYQVWRGDKNHQVTINAPNLKHLLCYCHASNLKL